MKLNKAGIAFTIVDDQAKVLEAGKANGINSMPILQVGDKFYDFTNAVKYINERN